MATANLPMKDHTAFGAPAGLASGGKGLVIRKTRMPSAVFRNPAEYRDLAPRDASADFTRDWLEFRSPWREAPRFLQNGGSPMSVVAYLTLSDANAAIQF